MGEYAAARQLNEDTLTRYRRVLGDDHPATLSSANNLALTLRDLGEHAAARQLNGDTPDPATAGVWRRPHRHPRSANYLTADLRAVGEHAAARELNEDTLTRRRRASGDDEIYQPETVHRGPTVTRHVTEGQSSTGAVDNTAHVRVRFEQH